MTKVSVTGSPFESVAVAVSVKGVDSLRDVEGWPSASVSANCILMVTVPDPPLLSTGVSSREILPPPPHEKRLTRAKNPNSVLKRKIIILSYAHEPYCDGKFILIVQLDQQSC